MLKHITCSEDNYIFHVLSKAITTEKNMIGICPLALKRLLVGRKGKASGQ